MRPETKKGLTVLALVSLVVLLLYLLAWFLFDEEFLSAKLRELAENGYLYFWGAAALAATISLPRQLIALAAGLAYGWAMGLVVCSLAVLTGNTIQFFLSRALLRPFLRKRAGKQLEKLDAVSRLGPFKMTLMLRLLPAGHSSAVNLSAGASCMPPLPFLSASYLGQLPQNAVFALAGDGFHMASGARLAIAGALLAASLCLGFVLYRRYKNLLPLAGDI